MTGSVGIDRITGKRLTGLQHLRQSIEVLLSTPIGSRVMRRDYGCRSFDIIDAPMTNATIVDVIAAVSEAIAKWEPRFRLDSVRMNNVTTDGKMNLDIQGRYLVDGQIITLEGIVI